MIRQFVAVLVVAGVVSVPLAHAQMPSAGGAQVLGTVRLTQTVLADGKPLAPGTYEVRLTGDSLKPLAGQTPGGERYDEFVSNGSVAGREVAVVMTGPAAGTAASTQPRVEMLRGGEFLRISVTRGGERYLIHLPIGPAR